MNCRAVHSTPSPKSGAARLWALRHLPSRLAVVVVLSAAAMPGRAQVNVQINVPAVVQLAPPPLMLEPVPVARQGMVWVAGHWRWVGNQYAWQTGYWIQPRPDAVYVPGRWRQVKDGWRWVEPRWEVARAHHHDDDDDRGKHKHKAKNKHKDKHGHGGGDFCPPGQAKKGNC